MIPGPEDDMLLGFDVASKRAQFFSLCSDHITNAQKKHPVFATCLSESTVNDLEKRYNEYAVMYQGQLRAALNRGTAPIETILLEEVYEFLEAVAAGDSIAIREEAADIVAVLYRAVNGEMKNESKRN